ncbi:MAG TPA: helix-turn-helix domain-containing protein [Caulobacteraceae bacterium]|nr:helix-turn-helix domain-containing protein [Caulobacteraceae bacterium]
MSETFDRKLAFVLKALSVSRGTLAAELGVDKSVVGRWVSGRVQPTSHNLSRLSAYIATRVDGFTTLDWERPVGGLASMLGANPEATRQTVGHPDALRLPLLAESRAMTARRAPCYEGVFRTTRPYAQYPGRFMHDAILIRRGDEGDLRFTLVNSGVKVEGVVLLQHSQLFIISADFTSGAYAFGILNGVNTVQAGVLDGLLMWCSLDSLRTPTASAILVERVADLTGDDAIDSAAFAKLCAADPLAAEGSLSPELIHHLTRDIGPSQIPLGGDWLLKLPLARSWARGSSEAIDGLPLPTTRSADG